MDNIDIIRKFMSLKQCNYLLVNSTNEYLVEYNSLEDNSRYKLTGFSGSTGDALVTPETIFLFVDGRYHIQADMEVNHEKTTVVKLSAGQKFIDELLKRIPENEVIGIFSKKITQKMHEYLVSKRPVKLFDSDPLDLSEGNEDEGNIVIGSDLAGLTSDEKVLSITQDLKHDEYFYITDLDEVSYILNMRNFSKNYSAKIMGKCLLSSKGAKLYTPKMNNELKSDLNEIKGHVCVDKSNINAYDFRLIKNPKEVESPVKFLKSQKNGTEILHLKEAFKRTDMALSAIRDYIYNNDGLSEYDISVQLEKEFKKYGAKNLSFKSIVAKDKNSALAHYSKSSKSEIIENGSLVLIDCGAYFEGGLATDITRVFVKGEPSALQKKIYTLVLKAFLTSFNYAKTHEKRPLIGYDIDNSVHEFFDSQDTKGFIFNHGLGHGIGINVHETPPNLSRSEIAKTPIKEGMCFTIEPGLYKQGYFGVRLENSCYYLNGDIHSFTNMNYEQKLIQYDLLSEQEKIWLNNFEVK